MANGCLSPLRHSQKPSVITRQRRPACRAPSNVGSRLPMQRRPCDGPTLTYFRRLRTVLPRSKKAPFFLR